jgi:UDP-N-acetylglucosamine 4-epimerase
MLIATRDAGVRRFVYASSSSVYGDSPVLPKREDRIGRQLSPYAVSKYANELYAGVFGRCYRLETIGLRYFNVFGPRQDPNGPYAAVIPRWIAAIRKGEPVQIYGDGKTSRDFCYVDNAVQANILAGLIKNKKSINQVYNVACGTRTTLSELALLISAAFRKTQIAATRTQNASKKVPSPRYLPEREGDVRHSLADFHKAECYMGYRLVIQIQGGITKLCETNVTNVKKQIERIA